jgi:hypothetical protein
MHLPDVKDEDQERRDGETKGTDAGGADGEPGPQDYMDQQCEVSRAVHAYG